VKCAPNLVFFAAAFCSFRAHARPVSNSESRPSRGAKFGRLGTSYREPVLDSHALSLLTSVFSNGLMDQADIKAATCLWDKMASPSLLSQMIP
jgi:hypothetical protein